MGRHRLLLAPLCLSALAVVLVDLVRRTTGLDSHRFLLWNLALAWMPLLCALALYGLRRRPALIWAPLALVWLLFLPNAPYLITDLVHYGQLNTQVEPWLDLSTLAVAAASGLLLGLLSLRYAHLALAERLGRRSWIPIGAAIVATSFGVYAGRIMRLNSWDAAHPRHVVTLLAPRLLAPEQHPLMVAGIVLFTCCLSLAYLAFWRLAAGEESLS